MAERMTDERLTEIECKPAWLQYPHIAEELLQAMKAERQEVERLRDDFHILRNQAEAAEARLARLVEGLEQLADDLAYQEDDEFAQRAASLAADAKHYGHEERKYGN